MPHSPSQATGRVAGKIAYVTGAGRGIGRAIAILLAAEGATVFAGDLDGGAAEETARLITGAGFVHDVRSADNWTSVIDRTLAHAGRLDILINNAGIALGTGANDIEHVTADAWSQVLDTNGLGTLLGCQHAVAAMKKTGGGAIVNMASIAGLVATPTTAPYGFSKAGIVQLTRSTAKLGIPFGIRCNAVHPGVIPTAMTQSLQRYNEELGGADAVRAAGAFADAAARKWQSEEDIASAVLFLASDEARFITGASLVVDGGVTL